ncbi:hypothetical protein Bbelb_339920 [Branchiostoma belcheri]|nr:hypothetical protein Bbelb_339920 [Branchiostoma belcheri]
MAAVESNQSPGLEEEESAASGNGAYPQFDAPGCPYIYAENESEDSYDYEAAVKISIGHGEESSSFAYYRANAYKEPVEVDIGHKVKSSPYGYHRPEDVYKHDKPEEVRMGHHDLDTTRNGLSYKEQEEGSSSLVNNKPEDVNVHVYKNPVEVSIGHGGWASSHAYNIPEDVSEEPEEVSTAQQEQSFSPDDQPDDENDDKDSENGYKTKDRLMEMWMNVKSAKACWLVLGCVLLSSVVTAIILATHFVPGTKEAPELKSQDDVAIGMTSHTPDPWLTAFYQETSSAANNSTLSSSPFTNTDKPLSYTAYGTAARRCQSDWTEYNHHCYKLFRSKIIWIKASRRCKQLGANLASVRDADENLFLTSLISTARMGDIRFLVWFGLNRRKGKGWRWTDGSPVVFRNWARGRPDNFVDGICVGLSSRRTWNYHLAKRETRGKWEDIQCFCSTADPGPGLPIRDYLGPSQTCNMIFQTELAGLDFYQRGSYLFNSWHPVDLLCPDTQTHKPTAQPPKTILPETKGTRSVACQDSNPGPLGSESDTLPLRHTTTQEVSEFDQEPDVSY